MHPTEKIVMHRGGGKDIIQTSTGPNLKNATSTLPYPLSYVHPLLHPKHGGRRYAENETYRTSDIRLSYRIG